MNIGTDLAISIYKYETVTSYNELWLTIPPISFDSISQYSPAFLLKSCFINPLVSRSLFVVYYRLLCNCDCLGLIYPRRGGGIAPCRVRFHGRNQIPTGLLLPEFAHKEARGNGDEEQQDERYEEEGAALFHGLFLRASLLEKPCQFWIMETIG